VSEECRLHLRLERARQRSRKLLPGMRGHSETPRVAVLETGWKSNRVQS
jgi:hypothetical protein